MAVILLSAAALFLPVMLFPQSNPGDSGAASPAAVGATIPEILRRPLIGEAPRYPIDRVIGTLGQGTAPDGAWAYANQVMSALITSSLSNVNESDKELLGQSLATLGPVNPDRFHIGGGRTEEDGTVSFLVRFLGRDQWMSGELFLLSKDDVWYIDGLALEDAHNLDSGDVYPYDFSPYERFF